MKIIGKQLLYLHMSRLDIKSEFDKSDHYHCEAVFYSNEEGSLFLMEIDCKYENQCENEGHSVFMFEKLQEMIDFIEKYPDKCSSDIDLLKSSIKTGFDLRFT
jgi:hypothetical protein